MSLSSRLIADLHHAVLTALVAPLHRQLHTTKIVQVILARVYAEGFSTYHRWTRLEFWITHPPHVLVSAKVLLQSRRAKGGFSFGAWACHA
jgi:hypothetical protein